MVCETAFDSPGLCISREAGGTRHYEFARHLVDQGHDVTIIASSLSYLTGQAIDRLHGLVSAQEIEGIKVLRAYTYPALHRSFVWRVLSFISFMFSSTWAGLRAGPVDVVMGTSPPIFQAVSACLVAILKRRPFLLEIRDLWPEFGIDMGVLTNPVLIRLSRWLERLLYRRSFHLLVNSPAYHDYLIAKEVAEGKITLIPNGVDPEMFSPEEKGEKIRARHHLEGKFVVTYAGALGAANDIHTILRAGQLLKGEKRIHILLVGDGKERANLEKSAEDMALDNVTFAGSCSKNEIREYLAASDAGLATLMNISMFRMTYPNKVFDYMAAGRPTVLGIDGVIRKVVEDAGGGVFVEPGNSDELANAILSLSRSPEKVSEMGRMARKYVEIHFNRKQQSRQFEKLVRQIVAQ